MDRVINAAEYFFHQGTNYRAYEYMGTHVTEQGNRVFRVWARNAVSVSLVGDFCGWDYGVPMEKVTDGGIWECTVSDELVKNGQKYKYKIRGTDGNCLYKSDPYCVCAEKAPNRASIIYDCGEYSWRDVGWMSYRSSKSGRMEKEPVNIYRLSPTEWNCDIKSWSWLAAELAPYVKQMGYTHIELASVAEPDFVYAPCSDMGTPDDFKAFVDSMHEAGIGVIIDRYMTESFNVDYGLGRFDGQPLYERNDNSQRYAISCTEVEAFLVSNAHYWFEVYHVDGLRLCGIENDLSMESVGFFGKLISHIRANFGDALVICDRGDVNVFENGGWDFDFKLCDKVLTCGDRRILSSPVFRGDMSCYRAEYGRFMTSHGKKLTEMGAEIASMQKCPDWPLLGLDEYARFQKYAAALGQLYLKIPALWQNEHIDETSYNCEEDIISFGRLDSSGEAVMIIINLTPIAYENYRVGIPLGGAYREVLNSDDEAFGGNGFVNKSDINSQGHPWKRCENSIVMRVAPMAISILKCVSKTSIPGKTTTASKTAKTKISNKN